MVDRRLGRGLDFFLSGGKGAAPGQAGAAEETLLVELDHLVPSPNQPRRDIRPAELQELADSVRASGILQPILARRVRDRFEIVAGERRWRAARLAGLERVPVLVRQITDDESAVFGLVENIQREDLNAIEKAVGFKKLQERLQCSQEDLARKVGLERSSVANFVRLLDLPDAVQAHVSRGTLSMGHARALLGLPAAEDRIKVADEAIKHGMSVRHLEQLVKDAALRAPKDSPSTEAVGRGKRSRPVWLNELEENLVEALGTPVSIRYGRKRSQIIIDCGSREEFERLYEKLKNV
jgi:ParB family transcriptional regulator, chromosome partitioning protein